MNFFRKINIYSLILVVLLELCAFLLMWFNCFSECSEISTEAILRPIMMYIIGLSLTLVFLLLFNPQTFKHWLIYIASWYIPISLFLLNDISIHSSNILATSRPIAALWLGGGLFVLTLVFLVVRTIVSYMKSR